MVSARRHSSSSMRSAARVCAGVLAVAIAAAGTPRVANADTAADNAAVASAIARVRADRAALRYRDALAAIDSALALGKASPAQLAELYRTAGELAAGLDEPTSAERWFGRWLALVPDGRLPADASPKVRAPLEAARAALDGAKIAITVAPTATAATVSVTVGGDPLRLVRSVRVRGANATARESAAAAQEGLPGASLSIATLEGDALAAAALDEHGNELVVEPFVRPGSASDRGRGRGRGSGVGAGTDGGAGERGPVPVYGRWTTWAAGTAVLAGAGGFFAWRTSVAQNDFDRLRDDSAMHTFDELETVRRRGERYALVTNIALGAAAVTAVVTVVLAVRSNGNDSTHDRATITPVVGADHAGVALAGSF
jgi:hypothetical protein